MNFNLDHNELISNNNLLSDKAKARLEKSKSDNTLKAYASDWRHFSQWCGEHNVESLPASPETVVNYMCDLADYLKSNTISHHLTAISENHIASGYATNNPIKTNMVNALMSSIRREKGTYQQPKTPVTLDILQTLVNYCGDNLQGLRDRVILLLGFAGAFRRSELVSIQVENLTFTDNGLVIFIPKSKADQEGRGENIAIPYSSNESICPVKATIAWLKASHISHGALFRGITKDNIIRPSQLSDKTIARVIKKYAEIAGFDPSQFAGHSLRRGFATTAAQSNVSVLGIMRQTRHKSEKMVHRYIEQGDMFKDNALNLIY